MSVILSLTCSFSLHRKNTSKFQIILYSGFFLPEILTMLGNHFHSSGNYFEASCKVRNKCTILAVTNDQYQHNLLSLLLVSHLYNTLNANGSVEFYTYIRVIDLSHHLQGYLYIIIVLWVCNLVLWHLAKYCLILSLFKTSTVTILPGYCNFPCCFH